MSRSYRKIIRNRKRRIENRLAPRNWKDQPRPMFQASNIHYEMAAKTGAISYGGIGAIHKMVNNLGLVEEIDLSLHLLKKHLPYHESDHVLNLAYNVLMGGIRLEGIELRRNDEVFQGGLGISSADRIHGQYQRGALPCESSGECPNPQRGGGMD